MENKTLLMPLVALRNVAVLPGMLIHFDADRAKSIMAVEQAMKSDQKIFVVMQRDPDVDEPSADDLHPVGCIVRIKQIIKLPGNYIRVLVTGEQRGELDYLVSVSPYFCAQLTVAEWEKHTAYTKTECQAFVDALHDLLERYFALNTKIGKEIEMQLTKEKEIDSFIEKIAALLPLSAGQRQQILNEVNLAERVTVVAAILANEIEELTIRKDLQAKVKERVEKNQKEYIMREQMKVIREELGEGDDASEYDEKLQMLNATQEIKQSIQKEIERYRRLGGSSSESAVARTYIETLLELPWENKTAERSDLTVAREILERDHFGLEKVKERLLMYLAVRRRTGKAGGTILCLVGPPGTGKTSIARSIAEALDKKYVRICLGGVRDEAEIRGHRRTYIGAMPGRIIAGVREAGVKNPLMLLDEIDKLSSDYKGDPSSALLEVLDPEQNSHFVDHYVDLPVDLSEVLFLATANTTDTIPRPLLDRMEIIDLSGYTDREKFMIGKNYLWKKELEKNGLKKKELKISDGAVKLVIDGYTREAGVRGLEKKLGEICRKAVWKIDAEENTALPIKITEKNLSEYLGSRKYFTDMAKKKPMIGVARGLAWTGVGGTTLEIEVALMPGRGELVLTGSLGDVMRESAQAALSCVRSLCGGKSTKPLFEKQDIHIHVPEGAVPKDGPSAGITMATALYSAIRKKCVVPELAMTGEITLLGRVLPIGGLKEKLLAAKQAGVKKVLVPEENRADVTELPTDVTEGLQIVYVRSIKEVLAEAIIES